ncbi:hypothetical protein K402DRAFT_448645 [Aulographum hederae CBS 113979]|uniref:Protein kinase domain-containing protein n=1 Tax=Aulographum hederae CBS 113979 TaxID=1176131 RepID=A0A6G1GP34_9PEZI|nr:hypothetical protein K402DRAFT_448645 [Aulographum hederae CBS 113979]
MPYRHPDSYRHFAVEKQIYRRLGTHPNAHSAIRLYFKNGGTASVQERIKWSRDLAVVIQYLHDKNVRQGDIGGRNILLDANRNTLLYDFAGSSIDDTRAEVVAQDGFGHPDHEESKYSTIRAEIHALGSSIFELITSTCPHQEEHEKEWGMAEVLLRRGIYPDVTDVPLGSIIAKCWKGEYSSAQEVADAIKEQN